MRGDRDCLNVTGHQQVGPPRCRGDTFQDMARAAEPPCCSRGSFFSPWSLFSGISAG